MVHDSVDNWSSLISYVVSFIRPADKLMMRFFGDRNKRASIKKKNHTLKFF